MASRVRFTSAFHLCSVAPVQRSTSIEDHCGQFAEGALGPSVDKFFVDVLVMTDDVEVRRARLSLVAHLRDVVLDIADVSELAKEPQPS